MLLKSTVQIIFGSDRETKKHLVQLSTSDTGKEIQRKYISRKLNSPPVEKHDA